MRYYAIICTRTSTNVSKTTWELLNYYAAAGFDVQVISGATSIFTAYSEKVAELDPDDDDVIIFCHDDISISESAEYLKDRLQEQLAYEDTGFVGVAGTTHLGKGAVWWNQKEWAEGKHRGCVWHLDKEGQPYRTYYGPQGEVAVMDGLFMACSGKTARKMDFTKPYYFIGEWDFYDIYYCAQARDLGLKNRIMNLDILHNSRGELVGRDSWHANREAFIEKFDLPMVVEAKNASNGR